ncbi:NAD-dependent protein deacetylase sirtuin-3, mitochondrial-like [Homalodisca vitripennis]|uniref:NAD-dependent protein deacetylase sirtuin-3, mitochondrial-like n=1 Tax=Homalodisca vitripennis TaxID=197043 RepID=UPI001EEC91B3|nr:NAD-dependent protein deacetylase sirtuin-3, mitochondrial-like [Homalodisca vitripennis]
MFKNMRLILAPGLVVMVVRTICRASSTCSKFDVNLLHKIKDSHKILVMAGAGLSTPSGIPDFRSPESGLYSNLQKYKLPYPEAIFDLHFYASNPAPFLDLAKTIYPGAGNIKPNIGHYFVRLLETKGKLLRMYTQNIDGLERLAGLNEDHLVEAHGGFSTASCISCGIKMDTHIVKEKIMTGKEPRCVECKSLVKPDITFFGEMLPERFMSLYEVDAIDAELLIVIGTSLVVYPFAGLADMVPDDIPRLLINRDVVGTFGSRPKDSVLKGDIIQLTKNLISDLGWLEDLSKLMNSSDVQSSRFGRN